MQCDQLSLAGVSCRQRCSHCIRLELQDQDDCRRLAPILFRISPQERLSNSKFWTSSETKPRLVSPPRTFRVPAFASIFFISRLSHSPKVRRPLCFNIRNRNRNCHCILCFLAHERCCRCRVANMASLRTSTITAMTSVFTPAPDCSDSWTFEGSYYNSISQGLLIQNLYADDINTACFPPKFSMSGRAPSSIQVYSPGACPSGYTTPGLFNNDGTTTAICCES